MFYTVFNPKIKLTELTSSFSNPSSGNHTRKHQKTHLRMPSPNWEKMEEEMRLSLGAKTESLFPNKPLLTTAKDVNTQKSKEELDTHLVSLRGKKWETAEENNHPELLTSSTSNGREKRGNILRKEIILALKYFKSQDTSQIATQLISVQKKKILY